MIEEGAGCWDPENSPKEGKTRFMTKRSILDGLTKNYGMQSENMSTPPPQSTIALSLVQHI